jgi:D-sedoheptulose 7-phosphate isomerase
MAPFADHLFAVASRDTARIQEAHILAGHMLCDWIELDLLHTEAAAQETAGLGRARRGDDRTTA